MARQLIFGVLLLSSLFANASNLLCSSLFKISKEDSKIESLSKLGYSESISKRLLEHRPGLVDAILSDNIEGIRVYRGVNTSVDKYDPQFKDGVMIRTGRMWVTQVSDTAKGFTDGLLITFLIPSHFGSQRVLMEDGKTIERMYVSRTTQIPDDRLFIESIYVPSLNRHFTYKEAIDAGIIKPL